MLREQYSREGGRDKDFNKSVRKILLKARTGVLGNFFGKLPVKMYRTSCTGISEVSNGERSDVSKERFKEEQKKRSFGGRGARKNKLIVVVTLTQKFQKYPINKRKEYIINKYIKIC